MRMIILRIVSKFEPGHDTAVPQWPWNCATAADTASLGERAAQWMSIPVVGPKAEAHSGLRSGTSSSELMSISSVRHRDWRSPSLRASG